MSRVQSGAGESARFSSGSVEVSHPLLRLAMRRLRTHEAYLHFRLVVRDLCHGRIQDTERVAAIDTLMEEVSTWLGEGHQWYEQGRLRCELLQLAAADCSDPSLLEELSYARLALHGLKVVWAQDMRLLPKLVATSPEPGATDRHQRWSTTRLWSEGAKDWAKVVGEAEARGRIWVGSLSLEQQDSVRRCLLMHSAFGSSPSSPGGAVKRQEWWRSHGKVILVELSHGKGGVDSDDGYAADLIEAMTDELQRQVDGGAIEVVPFELHEAEVQAAAHGDWHLVIRGPVPPASYKDDANELNRYRPRRPPKLPHPWPPKLLHLAGVN
jgi:hypothetical protein